MRNIWIIGLVSLLMAACGGGDAQTATVDDGDEVGGATGGVREEAVAIDALESEKPTGDLEQLQALTAYPTSRVLDLSTTKYIIEPEGGTRIDDAGNTYADNNYWNFCAPGAEAVVLYYSPWRNNPKYGRTNTYYAEQYGPHVSNTFWTSPSYDKTYGYYTTWRPSIMYLAEYSKPPTYQLPGVDLFTTYPTSGATSSDICASLNWEASDHATAGSYCGTGSYFYALVAGSTSFHSHVVEDVNTTKDGITGWALYAAVNTWVDATNHLPNWNRSLTHAIAIVGYDDAAGTYTYVDTCGIHCNGSPGNQQSTRVFTVSQSVLHNIMYSHVW